MGVAIHRKSGGIMPGVLLNGFHIVASPERVYHVGMPEIVKTMVFQTGSVQNLLQNFPYGGLGEVTAVRVGKYKIVKPPSFQAGPAASL